ncbi:MAG: hypothetical protein ACRENF_06715 [Thermodesulfobacteriota bacterium]
MNADEVSGFPVEKYLLTLALVLVALKVFGESAELVKQSVVLGELIVGVILRTSALAVVQSVHGQAGYVAFQVLVDIRVVILLLEMRLDTNLRDLISMSTPSTLVEETI